MTLGFAVGLLGNMGWIKNLVIPFTFLIVYPMMVTLKIREIFSGGDLRAQVIMHLVNFMVLFYGVNFILSTVLGRTLLPLGNAIAMVYGTVMRNLSIALAVAINAFGANGSDAALVWPWPTISKFKWPPGMRA